MSVQRHALIIGGTKGLGRALTDAWSRNGRRVSVLSRQAAETPHADSWTGWSVDLRDTKKLGPVLEQILTANGPVDDLVFAQRARGGTNPWNDEIATSLSGTAAVMTKLESQWKPERAPSVVMIVSLAARMVALEQQASYHAAKAGLEELTRFYAVTLARCGVRVNAVAPGVIRSRRDPENSAALTPEQQAYLRAIPLGRLAEHRDILEAIDFLCSARAQYITGQTLVVDGGLSLTMQHSLAVRLSNGQAVFGE